MIQYGLIRRITPSALLLAASLCLVLTGPGCKKDDSPAGPDEPMSIPETNLFPFVVGRELVYTEYSLDTLTSAKIPSTEHRHTIHAEAQMSRNGKNAFLLIDSVYTPGGQLESLDSTYAAVENGSLYLEFNGSWGKAFDRDAQTNTRYAVGTLIDNSLGFAIAVPVDGTIRNKEAVTTPLGTYMSYRLELVGRVTLGGTEFDSPQWYYFSDGVGIVKSHVPVGSNPLTGSKTEGSEMVLVSKSF